MDIDLDRETQEEYLVEHHGFEYDSLEGFDNEDLDDLTERFASKPRTKREEFVDEIVANSDNFDREAIETIPMAALRGIRDEVTTEFVRGYQ
jgi:hypothetical protein